MAETIDLSTAVALAPSIAKFRRLVTGHDDQGQAVFIEDKVCPNAHAIMGLPNFAVTELWKTTESPVDLRNDDVDPAAGATSLAPPSRGTVFRIVEFPPDADWVSDATAAPAMHRTSSLDYAYVIDGEIVALLDRGEALLRAGDVLIQRGTIHAWVNRSNKACKVLFVLIDATPPDLIGLKPA